MLNVLWRLVLLTGLFFCIPAISWAAPVHPAVPKIMQAEQAGVQASADPFAPAVINTQPSKIAEPLQLPPPPADSLNLLPVPGTSNAPVVIGQINGKTLIQTSNGIEVLSKKMITSAETRMAALKQMKQLKEIQQRGK